MKALNLVLNDEKRNKITTSITISPNLLEQARDVAEANKITVSRLISHSLLGLIQDWKNFQESRVK